MSLLKALPALMISLVLTAPAHAGKKVDWSEYIDPNPSKPVVSQSVTRDDAPARSEKKASKAKKKVAKAKAVKARKKKARH
jgi:hypothetical protein